jgi:sulfonate transport system ATP-binding protein
MLSIAGNPEENPTMPQQLLDLTVTAKSFADLPVLRNVHFRINAGEVVSLVGPRGCGKSTLLRIIAALDTRFAGEVLINGQPPSLRSRDVGLIFQEPRLLPWLSVAENVGFALGIKRRGHPLVAALLSEMGLIDCAGAYPRQLSGDLAQRVAIARGLCSQPSLLLLDEPFSALDAFTRKHLQDLLLSVASRRRTTLLLVTHEVNEAVYFSDRVIVLASQPGRISGGVVIGAPRPRDRRNPKLARKEAKVLTLLSDGTTNSFDLSYALASAPPTWPPVQAAHLHFAI